MRKITNLFIFLLSITTVVGQEDHNNESCLFEKSQQEYYQQDPKALTEAIEFEKKVRRDASLKRRGIKTTNNKYIIPVVFHVYGTDWLSNSKKDLAVTDEKIKEALQAINDDFAGFNDAVDPAFADVEGGMNIEFKLAQLDPNGNTTTGIIHHEYKEVFGVNGTKLF